MWAWYGLAVMQAASLGVDTSAQPIGSAQRARATARLRVVLVDERGEPRGRSAVSVCAVRAGDPENRCLASMSDADGRLVVEGLPGGAVDLQVRAGAHGGAWLPAVGFREGRESDLGVVRVSRRGIVRGLVLSRDGAPLPGAMVSVRSESEATSASTEARAVTNADGEFTVNNVPSGRALVRAAHAAFAEGEPTPAYVDPAQAPVFLELRLNEGARLVGRVVAATPSVDGAVELRRAHPREDSKPRVVTPDPGTGRFEFERLPPGPAFVTLRDATGAPLKQLDVDLADGETTEVEFSERRIHVEGRVTRAGVPLPGHSITLLRAGSLPAAQPGAAATDGPRRLAGVTDDDGRYELLADEPGSVQVRIQGPDGKAHYPLQRAEIPDVASHTLDVELPAAELHGVVVDEQSRPISGAGIVVLGRGPANPASLSLVADASGSFRAALSPGSYRVSAEARGFVEEQVDIDVTEGVARVRLELYHGLALEGVVVDSGGRPMPSVPVVLEAMDPAGGSTRESKTAADGSFRIEGLDGTPFTVVAGSPALGFAMEQRTLPSPPLTLRLRSAGRVRLTVLDGTGRPVAGAAAVVLEVNGLRAPDPAIAWSNGAGTVELSVPEGAVTVRVWKQARSASVLLQATAGATVDSEVTLPD